MVNRKFKTHTITVSHVNVALLEQQAKTLSKLQAYLLDSWPDIHEDGYLDAIEGILNFLAAVKVVP